MTTKILFSALSSGTRWMRVAVPLYLLSSITIAVSDQHAMQINFAETRADVTYTYDAGGRVVQAKDSSGNSITYTYDADGNITGTTYAGPNAAATTVNTTNSSTSSLPLLPSSTSKSSQPLIFR